jgi:putative oxidoreductase
MRLPDIISQKTAFTILCTTIGIIFITHGIARLYYGSNPDFGGFLNSQGLVIGLAIAWIITIGEIIFGSLLALGQYVRYCVIFHAVVILGGVIFVHFSQGLFVVGHGTGGVEYSVLILAILTLLYSRDHE